MLVGVNWTTYVYGVLTDRVLDAALGYFINPILTILLAVVVLRERLRPLQWAAVGLGVLSVVVISTGVGGIPWIALTVALSFALYGLLKNRTGRSVGALPGLAVETAVLTPAALVYLGVLFAQGTGTFSTEGAGHALLLMSCGSSPGCRCSCSVPPRVGSLSASSACCSTSGRSCSSWSARSSCTSRCRAPAGPGSSSCGAR